jgi:hypothetical protein
MKTCGKCGAELEGRACNACRREWRATNQEKVKAARKRYNDKNRIKVAESTKKWRSANPEKLKESNAKWHAANPHARQVITQNYRARKRADGMKLSPNLAARLFSLQRGKCACGCAQPLGDDYHLDHIMPLALGGTNRDDNIQLLRATCNQQKHAKHPVDFMQQRGFLL